MFPCLQVNRFTLLAVNSAMLGYTGSVNNCASRQINRFSLLALFAVFLPLDKKIPHPVGCGKESQTKTKGAPCRMRLK